MARSVDAAWDEMQREPSGRRVVVDVAKLLRKSMSSSSTSSSTSKNRSSAKRSARATSDVARLAINQHTKPDDAVHSRSSQLAMTEPFSLAKELNRLADDRAGVRKQAACSLERHLLLIGATVQLPDDHTFSDIAKPLFKRFNDPVEKVREVCLRLTTALLAQEQDLLRVLPYLMPAVANRVNSQWGYDEENQVFTRDQFLHDAFKRGRVFVAQDQVARLQPSEPSEELRLLFLELLGSLLDSAFQRNASSILHAYVFDILLILVSGVHDDFHDVNIRACAILQSLCNHMVSVMKHFTIGFVRTCKHLLIHRLARVRVAAVECVRSLVACPNFEKCKGSGTEAIVDLIGHRDDNVIPIAAFYTGEVRYNLFAKLDQDANPMVRSAFYRLIQDWILNLPDRYDHESRLMPYLLSAVSDELDETSREAMLTLEELGKRYEQEHGEEVLEMKQYGVDGKNPTYNYIKQLPAPFLDKRPSLGTRLFVRGRTRRFLNPILRELCNWQSPTRAHAVRLLKCVIVYSEETITVDAHTLIKTLLKTWVESDLVENAAHFQEIADLVGRFVAPKTYLPLLLARIRGEEDIVGSVVSPQAVGAALELLFHVLGGSLDKQVLPHVQELVDVLGCENVVAFETPRIKVARAELLLWITQLLQRRGRDAVSAFFLEHGRLTSLERVFRQLFEMAVSLTPPRDAEAAQSAASTVAILQAIGAHPSLNALYEAHFDDCFARAAAQLEATSDIQWKPCHVGQAVVDQLLDTASESFLLKSPQRLELLRSHFSSQLATTSPADLESKRLSPSARATHYQQLLRALTTRLTSSSPSVVDAPLAVQTLLSMILDLPDQLPADNATAA